MNVAERYELMKMLELRALATWTGVLKPPGRCRSTTTMQREKSD